MNEGTFNSDELIALIRDIYGSGNIPLHRPIFAGNERKYLIDCIDSNFVSSVGVKVSEFEEHVASFTGGKFAIATVNGTAALHIALLLAGVERNDEVITQPLTFIATCNAVSYIGAHPVFVDVDLDTLGLSAVALGRWLGDNVDVRQGKAWNRKTGRRVSACVPMHTFGIPMGIQDVVSVCKEYGIAVIEDGAEALGSRVGNCHAGLFGCIGTFSFNGNKIVTTGGGGMLVTNDEDLARRAKHLTTTAKLPHPYEFVHDEVGYNYRLPNLNAALGCAQMELLPKMLLAKAQVAELYREFFERHNVRFVSPVDGCTTNWWLNAVVLNSEEERDHLLEYTNSQGVMTRPVWRLMSKLSMFRHCQNDGLGNSHWLERRLINLPSSVPDAAIQRV